MPCHNRFNVVLLENDKKISYVQSIFRNIFVLSTAAVFVMCVFFMFVQRSLRNVLLKCSYIMNYLKVELAL